MSSTKDKPEKKRTVTFYEDRQQRVLYEMAYRGWQSWLYPGDEQLFFIRCDTQSFQISHVEKIDGQALWCPTPKDEESTLKTGAVKFASSADEYGSDEQLFVEVKNFIQEHVTLEPENLTLAAIYVFTTWVYNRFSVVPYLRAIGTHGTGKTRLIKTVGLISYRPIMSNGASSEAGIFRAIEAYGGTLLLDEAEFGEGEQSAAIMKILNAGNTKDASTLRCEASGDTFKLKAFKVFGPKLFSQRRPFDDKSTESRCLTITMKPGVRARGVQIDFTDESLKSAEILRNKLLMWRFRNWYKYPLDPAVFKDWEPEGVEDRVLQVVYPAMQLAWDKEFMKWDLLKAVAAAEADVLTERQNTAACILLKIISDMKDESISDEISIKSITDRYNAQIIDNRAERLMTFTRCSWTVRKMLNFKTIHMKSGAKLLFDKENFKTQSNLYRLDGDGGDASKNDRHPDRHPENRSDPQSELGYCNPSEISDKIPF